MEYQRFVLDMEVKGESIELVLCDTRLYGDRFDWIRLSPPAQI